MDEDPKRKEPVNPEPPAEAAAPAAKDPIQEEMAELRQKAAKADEYMDLARRARAEFLNYQDRIRRERAEWSRQAVSDFLRDLLPALDGLALARFEDPKLMDAVRLIEKEFLRILAKWGVVPMETAGRKFDPLYHEAVSTQEIADRPEGTILEEVRRGWLLEGRTLRPASVRVARPPSTTAAGAAPATSPEGPRSA